MDTASATLQLWNVAIRSDATHDSGHEMDVSLRGGPRSGLTLTTRVHGGPIEHLTHRGQTYRDSGHCYRGLRVFDWTPDGDQQTAG